MTNGATLAVESGSVLCPTILRASNNLQREKENARENRTIHNTLNASRIS
jgi:hypothetical protein